jgi:hypothetical protein
VAESYSPSETERLLISSIRKAKCAWWLGLVPYGGQARFRFACGVRKSSRFHPHIPQIERPPLPQARHRRRCHASQLRAGRVSDSATGPRNL